MMDVYNVQGGDLHSETARSVWHLEAEVDGKMMNANDMTLKQVKKYFDNQRRDAKSINFGIFYEMGAPSLASTINKSKGKDEKPTTDKEAVEIIQNFKRRFRGVAHFLEWSHDYAERHGYVRTITGRRRHLPAAMMPNPRNREEFGAKSKAMRQAVNSQVQGSASDIMGIAMRNIRRVLKAKGWWEINAMITNQVHDEITIEVDEDLAQEVYDIAVYEMENAVKLRCVLKAEGDVGDTWYECK